jgi:energy-coupling factor transport system permease/ATP-binding protein
MRILTVDRISYSYPESSCQALSEVSFTVDSGDYVAVLGTNGSGKSTLARLLCGFLDPDSGSITLAPGVKTGIVFQSPKDQIISDIVSRDTSFGPENLGLPPAETEERTIESLAVTGLLDRALSRTNALSLGQTQKLALSGILALHPDLLVLDESTSMLDPESRKEILSFIAYCQQHGQTVVHITHDQEEASRAQKIIVLSHGRVVFSGGQEDFQKDTLLSVSLFGLPLAPEHSGTTSREHDGAALVIDAVSFSYQDRQVFSGLNLSFSEGMLTAVTGESGSGKSTLLELAAGLLIPSGGTVKAVSRPVLAQQDSEAALFESFASDDVAFGPRNQGLSGAPLVSRVRSAMDMAGVPYQEFADRQTFRLSGGEKRKLSIAGILAMDAHIILFDEPTAGLDPVSRSQMMAVLKKLTRSGKTVIFTTHRMEEAAFADRTVAIHHGAVASDSYDGQGMQPVPAVHEIAPLAGASLLATLRSKAVFLNLTVEKKRYPVQVLPPAAKYILFFALFILSLSSRGRAAVLTVGITILYALSAHYPLRRVLWSYIRLIPWLIFFCFFQLVFFPPRGTEPVYFQLWWITVTPSKTDLCIRTVLHTLGAFTSVCVFIASTGERELLEGLSALLKPLSLIRVPVRSFVVIIEIIFRFIPLLIDEASSIIKTQLVRGGLGKADRPRAKIKILLPLFIPLVVQTVKRSQALADALTARYF